MRGMVAFAAVAVLAALTPAALAWDIYLDADTPATGSTIITTPLVTAWGNIWGYSSPGVPTIEIRSSVDPETLAAGSVQDCFDIMNTTHQGQMFFDFDIQEVTFLYGGNSGYILVEVRDANHQALASFYQASTYGGEPAGPTTLSAQGIREIYWEDNTGSYGYIDNLQITVPEPGALLLLGVMGLALRRR